MLVLTIYLVKSVRLTQSTALEEERFNLRSLSSALRNLRLLLVYLYISLFSHSVEHRSCSLRKQPFLREKRPQLRRARRNGCFRRQPTFRIEGRWLNPMREPTLGVLKLPTDEEVLLVP